MRRGRHLQILLVDEFLEFLMAESENDVKPQSGLDGESLEQTDDTISRRIMTLTQEQMSQWSTLQSHRNFMEGILCVWS